MSWKARLSKQRLVGRTVKRWAGIVGVVLLFGATNASAGMNSWTVNGPPGGFFYQLETSAADDTVLYATSQRALHKSNDSGNTWQAIRVFDKSIARLAVDPKNANRIYIAVDGSGLLRSDDGGKSFVELAPATPRVTAVGTNGLVVYYFDENKAVMSSTDLGQNWQARTNTPAAVISIVLDVNDSNSILAITRGINVTPLFRSTDGGISWTAIGLPKVSVMLTTSIDSLVRLSASNLVAATSYGLMSSSDNGSTWTRRQTIPEFFDAAAVSIDPNIAGTVVAVSSLENVPLQKSSDFGVTWSELGNAPGRLASQAIVQRQSGRIVVTGLEGVAWSVDNGATWSDSEVQPVASNIVRLATVNNGKAKIYALGARDIWTNSRDSGWQRLVQPSSDKFYFYPNAIAINPNDPNSISVAAIVDGIYHSSDGGATWGAPGVFNFNASALAFDPTTASTLYAVATAGSKAPDNGLYRSTDGGATWSARSVNLPTNIYNANRFIIDPKNSSRMFIAQIYATDPFSSPNGGLYRSDDAGITWTQSLGNLNVHDVAISPGDSRIMYLMTSSGILSSTDGGTTFNSNTAYAAITNENASSIAIDPMVPTTLYVSTLDFNIPFGALQRSSTILRSVDSGLTWEVLRSQSDAPKWYVTSVALDQSVGGLLYINTGEASGQGVATFQVAPDLSVQFSALPGTVTGGSTGVFDLRVENKGPFAATAVRVITTLPKAVANVTAAIDRGACSVSNAIATCTIPVMRPGDVVNPHITAVPSTTMVVPIGALVVGRELDPNVANSSVHVGQVVDLETSIKTSASKVVVGDAVTYTVRIANDGPESASATVATLTIDNAIAIATTPTGCTRSDNYFTCNVDALAVGAARTFTVNGTAKTSGITTFTANVLSASTEPDINPDNNSSSLDVSIDPAPPTPSPPPSPPTNGGGTGGSGGSSTGGSGHGGGSFDFRWLSGFMMLWLAVKRRSILKTMTAITCEGQPYRVCKIARS